MDLQAFNTAVDAAITNKTAPNSISPDNVGNSIKNLALIFSKELESYISKALIGSANGVAGIDAAGNVKGLDRYVRKESVGAPLGIAQLDINGKIEELQQYVKRASVGVPLGVAQLNIDGKIDELKSYVSRSLLASPGGVATLDSSGKLAMSQVRTISEVYKGSYNAATNTPELSDATGKNAEFYFVSVPGVHNFGHGDVVMKQGDKLIHNGEKYEAIQSITNPIAISILDGNAAVVFYGGVGFPRVNEINYVDGVGSPNAAPAFQYNKNNGDLTLFPAAQVTDFLIY